MLNPKHYSSGQYWLTNYDATHAATNNAAGGNHMWASLDLSFRFCSRHLLAACYLQGRTLSSSSGVARTKNSDHDVVMTVSAEEGWRLLAADGFIASHFNVGINHISTSHPPDPLLPMPTVEAMYVAAE